MDLFEQGYAYTGTGRHPERMTRHDPLTELDAQVAVIKMSRRSSASRRQDPVWLLGWRFRGARHGREASRGKIDGAVSFNARGTGGMAVANTWLDLPFTLKALLAPDSDLLVAPVPKTRCRAYDAWKPVMEAAQQTPEGRARIALAVAVSQWPTWGRSATRRRRSPRGPGGAAGGDVQVGERRPRQCGQPPAALRQSRRGSHRGTPASTIAKAYEAGADPKQKAIVEKLYKEAGLSGEDGIAADSKMNRQPRIEGSAGGVRYWLEPGRLINGDVKVPLLHVHGVGDALLPPHLTAGYGVAIEKAGKGELYRQAFVDAAGHCKTTSRRPSPPSPP